MAAYSVVNDRISLSLLDVHILVSLLEGQNNGFGLAQSCQRRILGATVVSSSNVYKSLKSMQHLMLVASAASGSADRRLKVIYRISSIGRMILEQEISEQARFVHIAQALLEETKKN